MLSHHPEIQEKVYEEVKTIFENKQEENLTLGDLSEMKLLDRVIKETLRLCPSVTSIGRIAEEDIHLGITHESLNKMNFFGNNKNIT